MVAGGGGLEEDELFIRGLTEHGRCVSELNDEEPRTRVSLFVARWHAATEHFPFLIPRFTF